MKAIGNFFKDLLIGIWIVIAVFTTVCLISYNDYNVSVFGKTSLVIIDNEELEPDFYDGDLVFVTKEGQKKYIKDEKIFFYSGNKSQENFINLGTITDIQTSDGAETAYYLGETKVSYSDVIGKVDGVYVMHNIGTILGILESRWGYMFVVIMPTLFALVYEIFAIINEVKDESDKDTDEDDDDKE